MGNGSNTIPILLMEGKGFSGKRVFDLFSQMGEVEFELNVHCLDVMPDKAELEKAGAILLMHHKGMKEFEALGLISGMGIAAPVILLVQHHSPALELMARKSGAWDYLVLDESLSADVFCRSISSAIEAKRAGDSLRESEEQYKALVENSPTGIWSVSRDGYTTYMNRQMREMLDIKNMSEISSYTYHHFFSGGSLERVIEESEKRDLGISSSYEANLVGLKDTQHDVVVSSAPLFDAMGQMNGTVGTFTDITERKKAELQLWASKEAAEEATLLKDKFISLVAHDLRGPLSTILSYQRMAVQSLEEERGDLLQVKRFSQSSLRQAEDMLAMIENLLNMGRIRTGIIKPEMRFANLKLMVTRVKMTLAHPATQKGVSIVDQIPQNIRLFTDRTLMEQVLQNLISNAIKFTTKGGTINISYKEDDAAYITVTDDGVGIEQERVDSLFSFDKKTSTIGTGGEVGTGLGLPLCRDMMDAQEGTLTATSSCGIGSSFTASLPLRRPLILILTEEDGMAAELENILKKMALDCYNTSGREASLDGMKAIVPDLIISDLDMERDDDNCFLCETLTNERYKGIPKLVVVGDNHEEERKRLLDAGVNDFIKKPISETEMTARVRVAIG